MATSLVEEIQNYGLKSLTNCPGVVNMVTLLKILSIREGFFEQVWEVPGFGFI